MPTRMAISPAANSRLPHQSICACLRTPMSCSMKYAHTVPNTPIGAETRKIRCQFTGARTPPRMRPMNDPAMAAIEFTLRAVPRWLAGNASVTMAAALANKNAPPMPCTTRQMISHIAPSAPCIQVTVRKIEATLKIAKPRVYIRTRPNMSPSRPNDTTSTADTTRKPMNIHSR